MQRSLSTPRRLYAELAAITALLEREINGGERVHVYVWFMYCCVRVRRPSYRDHHLWIDIEMLQRWRDPSVDPATSDTHLEHKSRGLLQKEEEEGNSLLPQCFWLLSQMCHFCPSFLCSLPCAVLFDEWNGCFNFPPLSSVFQLRWQD